MTTRGKKKGINLKNIFKKSTLGWCLNVGNYFFFTVFINLHTYCCLQRLYFYQRFIIYQRALKVLLKIIQSLTSWRHTLILINQDQNVHVLTVVTVLYFKERVRAEKVNLLRVFKHYPNIYLHELTTGGFLLIECSTESPHIHAG